MSSSTSINTNEVPTLLLRDAQNNELLCFLEQLIPIENNEYALLTPVDTPVSLFRLAVARRPRGDHF